MLLTGLVLAISDWCRRRGLGAGREVLLDIEGHGREGDSVMLTSAHSRLVRQPVPGATNTGAVDLDQAMAGGPALGRLH